MEFSEVESQALCDALGGFSGGPIKDEDGKMRNYSVSYDIREGLFKNLDRLEASSFTLNNPWKKQEKHWLWLLDYTETKKKAKNHEEVNKRKINALPEDVRKMFGY